MRRLLTGNARVDTGKLHALVLEGGTVPVSSIIKETIVTIWEKLLGDVTNANNVDLVDESTDVPRVSVSVAPVTGVSKRGPKAVVVQTIPGLSPFAIIPAELMSLVLKTCADDEAEEDINSFFDVSPQNYGEGGTLEAGSNTALSVKEGDWNITTVMTALPPHSWAPPVNVWPQSMDLSRRDIT